MIHEKIVDLKCEIVTRSKQGNAVPTEVLMIEVAPDVILDFKDPGFDSHLVDDILHAAHAHWKTLHHDIVEHELFKREPVNAHRP